MSYIGAAVGRSRFKEMPVFYKVGTICKMKKSANVFCFLDPDFYSAFTWPFVHTMHIFQVSWKFQNQIFLSIKKAYVHYVKCVKAGRNPKIWLLIAEDSL